MKYEDASKEPIDVIRANECDVAPGLATSRFQALWNEIERLQSWVADLQSGMYVNCVYCGHQYGPGETTPVSMADALKAHVEICPEHPMSALKRKLECLTLERVSWVLCCGNKEHCCAAEYASDHDMSSDRYAEQMGCEGQEIQKQAARIMALIK